MEHKVLKRGEKSMMNFNDKKTRKVVSTIIVVLLVVAMVLPMVVQFIR